MRRLTHAALLGLFLVACRKEPLDEKNDAPTRNPRFDALVVESAKPNDPAPVPPCAATNPKDTFTSVGESGGNTLALLRWHRANGTQTLAIAADEDEKALQIVDVD